MRAEALLAQAPTRPRRGGRRRARVLSLAAAGNPGNSLLPPVLARFDDELPGVERSTIGSADSDQVEKSYRSPRRLASSAAHRALPDLESGAAPRRPIVLVAEPQLARRRPSTQRAEGYMSISAKKVSRHPQHRRRGTSPARRQRPTQPRSPRPGKHQDSRGKRRRCRRVGPLAIRAETESGDICELDIPNWQVRRLVPSSRTRSRTCHCYACRRNAPPSSSAPHIAALQPALRGKAPKNRAAASGPKSRRESRLRTGSRRAPGRSNLGLRS